MRRFRRHRVAMAGAVALTALAFACFAAPWVAPKPFTAQDARNALSDPGTAGFLLGSDSLGRDQLSRLLYGGRVSLLVGASVAVLSAAIGTAVGSVAGYARGGLDSMLMRVTDLCLALPFLVVLIVLSRLLGGSAFDTVIVLTLLGWMPAARIVRGLTLSLREREFVEAARALGCRPVRIIGRHIVPNCVGPILVNLTLGVAAAILAESALSFLGYGVQPPTPTWGNMLAESRGLTRVAPWLVWFPGLAILVTVLAVNYVGDGLRDALDPAQHRRR